MTLHIEIDRDTEKQLAAIANLEKLSVEEVATRYVRDKTRERKEYNAKLRAKLKAAEISPLVEDFTVDGFLIEMQKKHGLNVTL